MSSGHIFLYFFNIFIFVHSTLFLCLCFHQPKQKMKGGIFMKKFKNLFLVLAISLSVVCAASVSFAASNLISDTTCSLSISSQNATCYVSAKGYSGVSKISCSMSLQQNLRGDWSTVQSWSKSSNSNFVTTTQSKSRLKSGKYRLCITTTASKSGKTQKQTSYSAVKSVK